MPEFNIPPRKDGIYIQMPKDDLEMVLAMLRNPANDSHRRTFAEIADAIEECAEGY